MNTPRLKELREAAGLSKVQLGEMARVDEKTIRRIEGGGYDPTVSTLRRLALALNVTIVELIAEEAKA